MRARMREMPEFRSPALRSVSHSGPFRNLALALFLILSFSGRRSRSTSPSGPFRNVALCSVSHSVFCARS
jgi:hypothetical protein